MKITCDCKTTRKLSDLKEFQGDIKTISDKNLDKLIMLIETHGFSVPFIIWQDKILDGHQRKKALAKMGYTGLVPVVEIEAENEKTDVPVSTIINKKLRKFYPVELKKKSK